jgi:hypothetical protein
MVKWDKNRHLPSMLNDRKLLAIFFAKSGILQNCTWTAYATPCDFIMVHEN